MTRTAPEESRYTRVGCQRPVTLHKLSPIQSMQVSAVNVSLTAGDNARMPISTSWSTPNETSWARVRYGPVTCALASSLATSAAAASGQTVA